MDKVIADSLAFSLPLFIIALGGIFCERSGITNLALEGFQGFGAFVGALAVSILGLSHGEWIVQYGFYIALLFAMLGGMIFSVLHAILCIRFRSDQVISGVVMNILSVSLTAFLTRHVNHTIFESPSDKFQLEVLSKFSVPILSKIPILGALFRDMYSFEIIILLLGIIAYLFLYKSRYGVHLRACGDNPQAVDSAGINVSKVRFGAVLISGALAGIGGMAYAYSISANFSPNSYMGYGYLSIAALIFGNWEILPTLAATLLFGLARSGGYRLAQVFELDSTYTDIVLILPYVVTLVVLIFLSKTNRAPRALGQIYDKGKR